MLRCKFQVFEVAKQSGGRRLKLSACTTTDGDNKDWSKYTPSGNFEIFVTNEAAYERIDALKAGDLFFIDLTPVPAT